MSWQLLEKMQMQALCTATLVAVDYFHIYLKIITNSIKNLHKQEVPVLSQPAGENAYFLFQAAILVCGDGIYGEITSVDF
ncbi:hypothetical protein D770_09055 [Flammeovirgaceae bacterium 311]|nr:hypothetical protein D770_09055 [Flammeovirgaceae bacterium 311]